MIDNLSMGSAMRGRAMAVMASLATLTTISCIQIGDPYAQVFAYHNASTIPIALGTVLGGPLHAPGEIWKNQWVMPTSDPGEHDRYTTRVEAVDQAGRLIFCQDFTYADIAITGWKVEVVFGPNLC